MRDFIYLIKEAVEVVDLGVNPQRMFEGRLIDNLPDFCDYVDACSIEDGVDEFFDMLCHYSNVDFDKVKGTFVLHKGFKNAWFYDTFREYRNYKLSKDTFETNTDEILYLRNHVLDRQYEQYVSDEYGRCITMDSFVRDAKEDVEYKLFASCEYHW